MSKQRIAGRYAKSLLDLASESNLLDVIKEDVAYLNEVCKLHDVVLMLQSPIINPGKKEQIITALFDGKVNKMTFAFLHIMLTKGRESLLPNIASEFLNQYKKLKGISTVTLTTATPASAEMIEQIRKHFENSSFTKNTVEILTQTKSDLLGGFTIEFEDKLYDASIKHQLDQLRKQFGGNPYVKSI